MTNLDVSIRAKFVNQLGAGAKAARADLKGVGDAARQLGRGAAGADKLTAGLGKTARGAKVAAQDLKAAHGEAMKLGMARVNGQFLQPMQAQARVVKAGLQAVGAEAGRLGATGGPARLGGDLERASGRAKVLKDNLAGARHEGERLGKALPQRDGRGRFVGGGSPGHAGHAGHAEAAGTMPPGALAAAGALGKRALAPIGMTWLAKRAFDQSVAWDSAWAEVRKKVNDADENQFKALEKNVRRLSMELGIGRVEMAGLVADAGAAGIAYADLEKFARLTAKAAVGWDMAPREASEKLAAIKSATGYTLDELAVVADKINALADNSSAKERDVLEMFLQVGEAAKMAGVKADTTMAILTAVRSGGMDPSVTSRWFGALTGGLRTAEMAPKRVQKGFRLLGLSTRQVVRGMKNDSLGTLLDLFERLEKSPKAVEAATLIFGREWWDETMRAKGGIAELRKQIEFLRNPANYQGSLDKNFAIQARTAKFHLEQLGEIVSRIGEGLTSWSIEPLNRAIDGVIDKMQKLEGSASWLERWSAEEEARLQALGILLPPPAGEEQGPPMPPSIGGDALQRTMARFWRDLTGDERTPAERLHDWMFGKEGQKDAELDKARERGTMRGKAEKDGAAATHIRGLLDQREKLADLASAKNLPEHLKAIGLQARATVEEIDRQLMAALKTPELGPLAREAMAEYVAAIEAEGITATEAARRIAAQIKAELSFTARPQIDLPAGAPAGGGAPLPPRDPRRDRRSDAGPVIHQHIHGADPHRVAQLARREQERALRTARAGALHDLGSWS